VPPVRLSTCPPGSGLAGTTSTSTKSLSALEALGMETRVVAAELSDKETLRSLFQLYAYDFSEVLPADVDEAGRFKVPPVEAYWTDAWRFPFLLRAGGHLAGFALVHQKSHLSGADDVWDMAEFFVLRRHRRAGVGMRAAHHFFATRPGNWEVRQRAANVTATAFWRRAIAAFTAGSFTEELLDDERWKGPVQRFASRGRMVAG
jgi:predicted acetyltransferase